ncbi:MAG: hypothetical protein CL681_06090 [Blastopirellula sp.]|nr:hypothetical protein [Blastopirellula sp.]
MRNDSVAVRAVVLLTLLLSPAMVLGQAKKPAKPAKPKIPRLQSTRQVAIAKVKRDSKSVAVAAMRIDRMVEKNYEKHNVVAHPMTTDAQFVRRVYLDITGMIPTLPQVTSFLNDKTASKRARLIDQLLNSRGYGSHSYNYWANILRLTDRPTNNIMGYPYNEWIKDSLRSNKPYDVWVREMLTAEGKIWDNPASGYLLRDAGMPLDNLNNTVRVFLGTRIGCAQCHDHPFDRWTQREFYELASFMHGVRSRYNARDANYGKGNPVTRVRAELEKSGQQKMVGRVNRILRANQYGVIDNPRAVLKFPHDYQYDDAKPGEVVRPKTLFGTSPKLNPQADRRAIFAKWMTSPENPRFTKTIANRLWAKAMGRGIIHPVDDMTDASKPENPELMALLEEEMVRLKYDMKEFLRVIYNTRTYQRQASKHDIGPEEVYHFPGPVLRRMTAEQVWDSFLALTVYNPDTYVRPSISQFKAAIDVNMASVNAATAIKKSEAYEEQFGGAASRKQRQTMGYKGQVLVRASELPQPLPATHFIRQFGQGDRELISGASEDGTVPQILTMFNGPITHMMLERGSVIYDNLLKQRTTSDRIDAIFLAVLGRYPTATDRGVASREIAALKEAGYGNVIWALVNTREFLFIQ